MRQAQAAKLPDRSSIPVTLIDLERLSELVVQYYEAFRPAAKVLIPLERLYWPAS